MTAFTDEASRIAAMVRSQPVGFRWFLACDNDADGLCAAAVTAQALLRLGHRFTIRASRDKDEAAYRALFTESWDGLFTLDKGSSHGALLGSLAAGRPVVILDHHNIPAPATGTWSLNPRACGLDGSRDASAATTAAALALALHGDAALPAAGTALAGAVGDWQHLGGWQGFNAELVARAESAGHIRRDLMPRFVGVTLAEALAQHRPAIPTLHRDVRAAAALLARMGIPDGAEVEDLATPARAEVVSAVVALHLAAGSEAPVPGDLVGPAEVHARLGRTLRQVFRIADACGRAGAAATGIAWLMGDATAEPAALRLFESYRTGVAAGLALLRSEPPKALPHVQHAMTSEAAYTGMVAGTGMTHLVDPRLPLAIMAPRPDGRLQVSTRGLHEHVARGLDLGRAVSAAAAAVGAEGGGHPIAAGAVIPGDRAEPFLAALDAALGRQGFLEAP